ncbi:hypothetical protein BJV78DRAFT_1281973 [Lactifluus subvellereus]|nr:hypothetical protein BJV78DRAFT_1281973 [Lactifluus subvellereus]
MTGSDGEGLADLDYALEELLYYPSVAPPAGIPSWCTWPPVRVRIAAMWNATSDLHRIPCSRPRSTYKRTRHCARRATATFRHSTLPLRDLLDFIHLPDGRLPGQDSVRVPVASPILAKAHAALDVAANFVQASLQAAMLSPLHKSLTHLRLFEPVLVKHHGEQEARERRGLLNLPRLFEVYADDDVFAFSIETLPHVDIALLESLAEPAATEPSPIHARRASTVRLMPNAAAPTSALTPEAIASVWLSSLGLSFIKHVTQNILPSIGSLTTAGAAQLWSDLSYLGNIVSALSVESQELSRWIEVVSMDDKTGKPTAVEVDGADSILNLIARMRGWAHT